MKFFEALNSRVIALILKKSDAFEVLSIDCGDKGAGIKTSTGDMIFVQWSDLVEAIGIRRFAYATDNISLLLVFQSAGTFEILPSCNGWLDLCSRVEHQHKGMPLQHWYPKILDKNAPVAIEAFNRNHIKK